MRSQRTAKKRLMAFTGAAGVGAGTVAGRGEDA
jgi:hypothetical protein